MNEKLTGFDPNFEAEESKLVHGWSHRVEDSFSQKSTFINDPHFSKQVKTCAACDHRLKFLGKFETIEKVGFQ